MSRDMAQLAKRISSVTSKCLLTAVVLAAGLGFGGHVLRWWSAEPRESAVALPPAGDTDGLGDPWRMHVVQFGDRPGALGRQSIAGDKQAAATALRRACRDLIAHGPLADIPNAEALAGFLPQLDAREPIDEQPGQWRLYAMDEVFPIVIGTQPPTDETQTAQRVVVWGMALPMGDDAWTVFTFQPDDTVGLTSDILPEMPLPEGCRRTLSMRVAGGGATLAFEGPGEPSDWIGLYNRWFSEYNWSLAAEWQPLGDAWYARFTAPGPKPAGTADVHLRCRPDGQGTGLVIITPASDAAFGVR